MSLDKFLLPLFLWTSLRFLWWCDSYGGVILADGGCWFFNAGLVPKSLQELVTSYHDSIVRIHPDVLFLADVMFLAT
jgi:hypothetical protein